MENVQNRVWIYARIASGNPDDLASLEIQIESLKHYAAQQSYTIEGCTSDVCSGFCVHAAGGYMAMVRAAEQHRFKILLVRNIDRLGRAIPQMIANAEQLLEKGIAIEQIVPREKYRSRETFPPVGTSWLTQPRSKKNNPEHER